MSCFQSKDPKNRIEFNPNDSRLAVFVKRDDKGVLLISPMSPKEAADKMDGSGSAKVKNFFNRWGANMANRTATANSTTNGTVTVVGADGIRSGTYEGRTTTTVAVPDEEARSRAEENVARRAAQVEARQNAVMDTALRANTIFAGKDIFGRIYFPRKKGEYMYVSIKVGDTLYI